MKKLWPILVVFFTILIALYPGFARGEKKGEQAEGGGVSRVNRANKVVVIMGDRLDVTNIRDAILERFSDFKVRFAENGRELGLVLEEEYLDAGPVTDLKIIDHGHPGWLENLDPDEIPFGTFLSMAKGAAVEVYACNYGHSIKFIRQNLALPLLGYYGGTFITYKGWLFPFSISMPTEDDNPNKQYLDICGICEVPKPGILSPKNTCSVIDEIIPMEGRIVEKYSKMLSNNPDLDTRAINSGDFFLDIGFRQ